MSHSTHTYLESTSNDGEPSFIKNNKYPYSSNKDEVSAIFGNTMGFPFENKGLLMSIWLRTGSVNGLNINIQDIELITNAIGNTGFGNLNRANCIGTNVYMGERYINSRSMASPIEGPCQSYKNQHYRSH